MAIADVDENGTRDVVVGRSAGVSVLLNTGNAVLGAPTHYALGFSPAVAVSDMDGDRDSDIAVVGGGRLRILLNQGGGVFSVGATYTQPGVNHFAVAVADLNGDGYCDVVATNDQEIGGVLVYRNNGDATFASPTTYGTGRLARSVAIADLNGDGNSDVAVTNIGNNRITALRNQGDGTFSVQANYGTGAGTSPSALATGDLNRDGGDDLVVLNTSTNTLAVLPNGCPAQPSPYLYGLEAPTARLHRIHPTNGAQLQTTTFPMGMLLSLARDGTSLLSTSWLTNDLLRLDPFSGQGTVIGPMPQFNFRGLEVDPTSGSAYLVTDQPNRLFRVDKTTGGVTLIGAIGISPGQVFALAINSLGTAFIVSGGVSVPLRLHKINLATASISTVGLIAGLPPGNTVIEDLAFDQNDTLHAVHVSGVVNGVYTVNTKNGNATFSYSTGSAFSVSIAFLTTCPGQAAIASNYGIGWAGTHGVPSLRATNPPRVGGAVTLRLDSSLGSPTLGAILFGGASSRTPTPYGGMLLVEPPFNTIPLSVPVDGGALLVAVPNLPSFSGSDFYLQGVLFDGGASHGVSFTSGLWWTLGS